MIETTTVLSLKVHLRLLLQLGAILLCVLKYAILLLHEQ